MASTKTLQEEVSYWISLEKEGIDLYENNMFLSWLKRTEKNKKAFEEEKDFLAQVNALPNSFLDELKQEVKENRKRENRRKKFVVSISSIVSAACILLIAYFSFFTQNITFSKNYIASSKIREHIVLPDNSIVALDANTSMNVIYSKNKREIYLSKGKAFFSVAHNKKRPFFVRTSKVNIKVLGTKFEVLNNKNFQVNVKEGKVRVANHKDDLIALVTKEQSLSLDRSYNLKAIKKKSIDTIALWSKGELDFKQESLKNVLATFSKYQNINVKITNKDLENLPISGNFTSKEFNKFIKVLPLIHPVKIKRSEDQIIISKKI